MNFQYAFKVFELNTLRQAGVAITPQQVGLKTDPIAALQLKNATQGFGSILGNLNGTTSASLGISPPSPPVPPTDTSDSAAQAKYQQALLVYNNQSQVYNQQIMRLMLNQFQQMQQSIYASQQQQQKTTASSSASGDTTGVGGILSGPYS